MIPQYKQNAAAFTTILAEAITFIVFLLNYWRFKLTMSTDNYKKLAAKLELYSLLRDGMNDYEAGNMKTFGEAMSEIQSNCKK